MPSKPRAIVVGAGPAGLTAADALASSGADVTVLERSDAVGGLARTLHLWGRKVELGPHVLGSGDAGAAALLHSLIGGDATELPLRRGMQLRGRVMAYPPSPWDVATALSLPELVAGGASLLWNRSVHRTPPRNNARDWFTARFGAPLYEAVVLPILRKLWGRDGRLIDAAYSQVIGNAAGASRGIPSFRYPTGGLSQVWDRLAARIRRHGEIRTGATIDALSLDRTGVTLRVSDTTYHADSLLWSAPLRALLALLPDAPGDVVSAAHQIETRHCVVVHALIEGAPALRWATVFVGDEALAVGRVSDGRFWLGDRGDDAGVVTMEYWCSDHDAVWLEGDEAIAKRAAVELAATGLFRGSTVQASHIHRLRGVLPVPTLGSRELVDRIQAHVASLRHVHVLGRHASFTYDSTVAAMAQGLEAARTVARKWTN